LIVTTANRNDVLLSRSVQAVTINYKTGAVKLAHQLLGRRLADEDLARLAGALDGARVNVSAKKKGWLYLAVGDPARFEVYETSVRRDLRGDLYAYIHEVRTAVGRRGQGLGLEAFRRQVAGARALGVKRFELFAAGDPADISDNGYYTWARFGFDAPLYERERIILPPELSQAVNVNDLMQLGGHRWWFENGGFRSMVFDLSDGSAMMNVFRDYLKEKGIAED
jgi:hypothetical protein